MRLMIKRDLPSLDAGGLKVVSHAFVASATRQYDATRETGPAAVCRKHQL